MEAEPSDRISRLIANASRLRLDAGAAGVLQGFDRARVGALLLKGPSIATWLYASGAPRLYWDCDLLIAPGDQDDAERVLQSMAYKRSFDDRGMPSWWREHASTWVRDDDGLTVDLHRTLPGVGADLETTWRVLSASTDVVVIADYPARTLALPARALHIALHAAQHGVDWSRPMADLDRALRVADDGLWRAAAAMATELQATEAFATGLRLAPAGTELAARLKLPAAQSVDARLRAGSPPPLALGFEQLARARGARARLGIVARKVVPPVAFVRHWDPRAGESRVGLFRAYLRRPLWLLRRAPAGLGAWRRARRSVRGGSPRDEP